MFTIYGIGTGLDLIEMSMFIPPIGLPVLHVIYE